MTQRFLALWLALCSLAVAACDRGPSDLDPPEIADVVFHGGPVLTMAGVTAEALAVLGTEILAVGTTVDIMTHVGAGTVVVDLNGGALLPGFIDGHTHLIAAADRQGLTAAEAIDLALSYGITTVVEAAQFQPGIDRLLALDDAGELRLRVVAYANYNRARPVEDGEERIVRTWLATNPPLVDPDRMLRIPGVKIFVDGAFSDGRGCYAMTEPYEQAFQDSPGYDCPDPRGSLLMETVELTDAIVEAEEAGFLVAMHAIGDRALDVALDALAFARLRTGNAAPRHQIHHGLLLRPDQRSRALNLDVPLSVQGYFHSCDNDLYRFVFGDRHVWYANRFALANAGGRAFVETDFNFPRHPDDDLFRFYDRPLDPLVNLWGLVTHREIQTGPVCEPEPWLAQHPVAIETALGMYTFAAAYAHGIDHLVGSLWPGRRADLVVLSGDPTAVAPDDLLDLRVRLTMVDGRVEYCGEDCVPAGS